MATPTMFADLTDQHIQDVGRRIEMGVREDDDLTQLFEADEIPEGRVDAAYRVLIPQRISQDDVSSFVLHENIAPANRTLKYATYRKSPKEYGTRHEYTSKAVKDSVDSVINDSVEDLENWAILMKKYSAAGALMATHSAVAPVESSGTIKLMDTFDKVSTIFSDDLEGDKWADNKFLAIMPGRVNKALRAELRAADYGNSLPESEKMKAFKGYAGDYDEFSIFTPKGANKYLQDDTNYYIIFVARTDKGTNPLRILKRKGAWTELHHHPLGSGVMKNAQGEPVADYNNQKGGIGMNLNGFIYYIRDDRFVLLCTLAKSKLPGAPDVTAEIPADGDDDGTVYQTIDRVITGHGGTSSVSAALAITGATAGDDIPNGSSVQLYANHDVIWSSSDTTKMVVDETGKVTAKAASGSATISAFDGTATATISLDCAAAS